MNYNYHNSFHVIITAEGENATADEAIIVLTAKLR